MAKFKIGDTVRILDGSTIPEYTGGWFGDMKRKIGNIRKIKDFVSYGDKSGVILEDEIFTWDERGLELANATQKFNIGDIVIGNEAANSKYVVTRKGWIGKVVGIRQDNNIQVEGKGFNDEIATFKVNSGCFDKYTTEYKSIAEDIKMEFTTKEEYRIDKSCNKQIPTITTSVAVYSSTGKFFTGSATCDKSDYDERQGVLEALANGVCADSFDKLYTKAVKQNKQAQKAILTCSYCGKVFDTVKEKDEHEAWHVERKKARRERYLLRRRAKEIAFEEAAQKMAKEMQADERRKQA